MTIKIKTDALAAIAKWAYRDIDRPHLNCLLFDNGEIVATDGHRLVRVPHTVGSTRFSISRGHVLAAVAAQDAASRLDDLELQTGHDLMSNEEGDTMFLASPRGDRMLELELKTDPFRVEIAIDKAMLVIPASPAKDYPDISVATPTDSIGLPPAGITFNPLYLAAIAEVCHATGERWPGVKVVAWKGVENQMMYRSERGIRFVVMPQKDWEKEARTKAHQRSERRSVAVMEQAEQALHGDKL